MCSGSDPSASLASSLELDRELLQGGVLVLMLFLHSSKAYEMNTYELRMGFGDTGLDEGPQTEPATDDNSSKYLLSIKAWGSSAS